MAVRSCLLCGKPLSRIWAGTGEDFCSREHRNQYRLRRGMERLSEANQIATVMRRREQPKQIPTGELRSAGVTTRRGFLSPVRSAMPEAALPTVSQTARPQLNSTNQFLAPQALAGEFGEPRSVPAPLISGRPLSTPRLQAYLRAHVNCAPPLPGQRPVKCVSSYRTERVKWTPRALPLSARIDLAQQRFEFPMRAAKVSPCLGRALRVSMAKAFRLSTSFQLSPRFTPPGTNDLPRPKAKRLVVVRTPREREKTAHEIVLEPQAMRTPAAPQPNFERRFSWPDALEVTMKFRNTANGHRSSAVPFGSPDESQTKERK